jgi:ribosomal protein S12 methylthiotransferase accessory factor
MPMAEASAPAVGGLDPLSQLLNPVAGIVGSLRHFPRRSGDPRLWIVDAKMTRPLTATEAGLREFSAGAGYTKEAAYAAALGEAAERYALMTGPDASAATPVFGSGAKLGLDGQAEAYELYSPRQYAQPGFPFVPFTSETPIWWAPAIDYLARTEQLVPLQLLYWDRGDEAKIAEVTTNGAACGPSFDSAAEAAVRELLERDATMLAWYCKLSSPRIVSMDAGSDGDRFANCFGDWLSVIEAVDLTQINGAPVVLAGVVDRSAASPIRVAYGMACKSSRFRAFEKAVFEAWAVLQYLRRRLGASDGDALRAKPQSAVLTFPDHAQYYARPENWSQCSFLHASNVDAPKLDPDDTVDLATVLQALRNEGVDVYVADITPPDIRELGLFVVRAISPQLRPINASHPFLGGERVQCAAWRRGLVAGRLSEGDLNQDPHPIA